MTRALLVGAVAALVAGAAAAQSSYAPPASFERGHGQQTWQNPGYPALIAKCRTAPTPFSINVATTTGEPTLEFPPASPAIPGVLAAGQTWKTVWAWQGNNVDGPIAQPDGTMLFANNDAGSVMQMDPATGRARILFDKVNTGGAVSRSTNGALFVAERGLPARVSQLEPTRKVLADSYDGEPIECIGGIINDISADARGGVYMAVSGGGVLYADPAGKVSKYGEAVTGANGIILSADGKKLFVGNGRTVVLFDVAADGALTNQRDFATLHSGRGADGSAIDSAGRLYVATGGAVDVFSPTGAFLGTIAGPPGLHGVAFGGKDKKTLYAIVFYGGWGAPSARNQMIAIPTLAQGYMGRAK
jgi:gluconolactonase